MIFVESPDGNWFETQGPGALRASQNVSHALIRSRAAGTVPELVSVREQSSPADASVNPVYLGYHYDIVVEGRRDAAWSVVREPDRGRPERPRHAG
jgi:hypothetical protein